MLRYSRVVFFVGAVAALSGKPKTPALRLAERVAHRDVLGREPIVVELPDGALFVSGYGSGRPTLWKSADRGVTWKRVNVGTAEALASIRARIGPGVYWPKTGSKPDWPTACPATKLEVCARLAFSKTETNSSEPSGSPLLVARRIHPTPLPIALKPA